MLLPIFTLLLTHFKIIVLLYKYIFIYTLHKNIFFKTVFICTLLKNIFLKTVYICTLLKTYIFLKKKLYLHFT